MTKNEMVLLCLLVTLTLCGFIVVMLLRKMKQKTLEQNTIVWDNYDKNMFNLCVPEIITDPVYKNDNFCAGKNIEIYIKKIHSVYKNQVFLNEKVVGYFHKIAYVKKEFKSIHTKELQTAMYLFLFDSDDNLYNIYVTIDNEPMNWNCVYQRKVQSFVVSNIYISNNFDALLLCNDLDTMSVIIEHKSLQFTPLVLLNSICNSHVSTFRIDKNSIGQIIEKVGSFIFFNNKTCFVYADPDRHYTFNIDIKYVYNELCNNFCICLNQNDEFCILSTQGILKRIDTPKTVIDDINNSSGFHAFHYEDVMFFIIKNETFFLNTKDFTWRILDRSNGIIEDMKIKKRNGEIVSFSDFLKR